MVLIFKYMVWKSYYNNNIIQKEAKTCLFFNKHLTNKAFVIGFIALFYWSTRQQCVMKYFLIFLNNIFVTLES
jgi:hypothetical protein